MPAIVGNIIVLVILGVAVAFAVRSLIKAHKSGGCCGDCCSCGKGGCSTSASPSKK